MGKYWYSNIIYRWVGDRYVMVSVMPHPYEGPVACCKGDDTLRNQEIAQAAFNTQLMGIFQQQFGKQSQILNYLKNKMQPIVNAGGTGYAPNALAAMRTTANDQISMQTNNAQKALQAREFTTGGRDLPSGVNAQLDSQLLNAESMDKAGAQNNITLQNENLKQANYWNAINALSGNAAMLAPQSYGQMAQSGASGVATLGEAYKQSTNGFWSTLGNSFASSLGNTLGGGKAGAGSATGAAGFFGI